MPSEGQNDHGDQGLIIPLLRDHGRALADLTAQTRDSQAQVDARLKGLELAVTGAERSITKRQDVANGRTDQLERNLVDVSRWQHEHDRRRRDEDMMIEAAAAERARLAGNLERVRKVVEDWSSSVILAGGLILTGVNLLFWWMR